MIEDYLLFGIVHKILRNNLVDESGAEKLTGILVPELLVMAKQAVTDDRISIALCCYERAQQLEPSEKFARRIQRFKVAIQ